jgi:hypothetical protein
MILHQGDSLGTGWCLLSVVTGEQPGYRQGQLRLLDSAERHRWPGGILLWRGEYPPASPTHERQPYAFKVHACLEAVRMGYQRLLWVDSVCWFTRGPGNLLRHVLDKGHLLFHGGDRVGQWCSDRVAAEAALDREELMRIPLVGGSVYAFDFANAKTRVFFAEWAEWCRKGRFAGFAINDQADVMSVRRGLGDRPTGFVSTDPRVHGHKHDETAASVIASDLGMELTPVGQWFDGYAPAGSPAAAAAGCPTEENERITITSQGF